VQAAGKSLSRQLAPYTLKNRDDSLQNYTQDSMAGAIPGHDQPEKSNSSRALWMP
jgi:hypothetical protein